MTNLFFFGSDQYSQVVFDYLQSHSQHTLTRCHNFNSLPPIAPQTIGLSASFPYLFPPDLISAFHDQLYNLHPSLLPQYRNVAPIPYAIAMGDPETGITLQRIDEKIDHGDILAQLKEPILPTDTTPILLHRLFTKGADLFLNYLNSPTAPTALTAPTEPLIFTRKLSGESGHLEWPLALKMINNEPISPADTQNVLINLRLHKKLSQPVIRNSLFVIRDLIRALDGYEKVWTIAPTRKGDLRVSFVLGEIRNSLFVIRVLIPGKPRPISWNDFTQYYL